MNLNDPRPQGQPRARTETDEPYNLGTVEVQLIADMLRIENISNEVRDLKEVVNGRLDKLENWIVGIVGLTVTSLVAVLVGLISR